MLYSSCTVSRQDKSVVTQASESQISKFDLVTQTPFQREVSTWREYVISSSCWGLARGRANCPGGVTGSHQPLQDRSRVTSSTLDP